MKKLLLGFYGVLCIVYVGHGQEDIQLNRDLDFALTLGGVWQNYDPFTDAQWNLATPNITNPNETDTAFHYRNQYGGGGKFFQGFSLAVNLNKRDNNPKLFSKFLRFSYQSGVGFHGNKSWQKITQFTYDTVVSTSTGEEYYLDSITRWDFMKDYETRQRLVSLHLLFHLNKNKRFSFYGGFGLGIGISGTTYSSVILTRQETNKSENPEKQNVLVPVSNFPTLIIDEINQRFQLEKSKSLHLTIPIGMDIKLGKKDDFLSKFVLGTEFLFGYNQHKIPKIGSFRNSSYQNTWSIKFCF